MNGGQYELKDIIRVEGIVSKGYGMLPYFVMQAPFLSVNAKCVYAYFCSYTGGGESTLFPGISKIMSDLQMSKNRYYEAYNQLQNFGLLSVVQKKNNQHFDHNEYTLLMKPVCVMAYHEKYKDDPMGTRITVEGIHAWGYGNIPKAVMLDDRLDAKEKSLYAYFSSLAGFRYSVQPDRDRTIKELGISHNTYNKYMLRLQELNYITVSRTRAESGRGFGSNLIFLNIKPDEELATLNSSRGTVTFVQPNFEETKNKETKIEENGLITENSVQPNFKEAKNKEPKIVEAKNEETNNIVYNTLSNTLTRDLSDDDKDIPTLLQVKDFIETAGYAAIIDYREFFNYYQDFNWCDSNGRPVLNWKAKVRSWVSHNYKPPKEKKEVKASVKPKKDSFHNFEERKTDFDSLIENYEPRKRRGE